MHAAHGTGKRSAVQWVDKDGQQRNRSFDKKADAQREYDATMAAIHTYTYADPRKSATTFGTVAVEGNSGKHLKPLKDIEVY